VEYSKWRDAIFQVLYAYKNVNSLVISHGILERFLWGFISRDAFEEAYISTKELIIKRALIATKETYVSTREPNVSAKEPYESAKRAT